MTALVPLLLQAGLAAAQLGGVPNVPIPIAASTTASNAGGSNGNAVGVSVGADITAGVNIGGVLPTGCPCVLTLTVIPPDYSGSLLSLPISLRPTLPTLSLPLPSISLPQITGLPLPTDFLPSGTIDLPTISLPVSAILPTIPLPSGTPVSYSCPEADGRIIIQNLLPYAIDCGASAMGSVYTSVPAVDSFNDCFLACDRSSTDQGAKYCTGWYYEGAADGDGAGTCYLQNSVAQGFSTQQSSNRVAGVRLLNYLLGGGPALPTLLPTNLTITTQLPGVISCLIGDVTGVLPTELPLTTQVPGIVSSLLGDLTSGLPNGVSSLINDLSSGISLPNNISLTTELPNAVSSLLSEIGNLPTNVPVSSILGELTNLPPGLSSIIGDITGALPTPTPVLPITSIVNDLSSILNSPSGLPLSSLGNDLSSLLGNPTQGVPGAVSSLIGNPTQGIPGLISSILNGGGGVPVSSLLSDLTALPTITPPFSLPTNLPSGSLPSLTNIIPTSLPSGIIPPVSIPSVGTNLLSTTGPNGLPTLVSITPSVALPSVLVSLPTDLSLTGLPTNFPTTGLGSLTTIISVPSGLPSLSISAPSLSGSIPSASLSVPSLLPGGGSSTSSGNPLFPTATAFPIFSCPMDTSLAYVSPSGQAFMIQCNTQVLGYDISTALQPDLQSCVNSCGSVSGCTNVAFQSSTRICTYKSQNGQSLGATTDFSAAIAIDLSCPNGNGVTYLDPYGSSYTTLCNYTFPSRTEIMQAAAPSGRLVDEGSPEQPSKRAPADALVLLECSIRCSVLARCLAVTETEGACIFISALAPQGAGSAISDTVVMVGRRIVTIDANGNPVTSTSTAVAIPTVATSRSATIYNPPATTPNLGISTLLTASLPPVSLTVGVSATLGVSAGVSASLPIGGGSESTVSCGPGLLGLGACTTTTTQTPTPYVSCSGGLAGLGAVCVTITPTPRPASVPTTSTSLTRTQITITVPVTTLVTTSTVTACSTNFFNQAVCPTVNVVETIVGTRTTVTQSFIAPTSSTLITSTRSSSSSSSSSSSRASSTTACGGLLGLGC